MEEHFETFDDTGEPRGLVPRSTVHREGLWHRAVHVYLFRSDGKLLLQRRQRDKDIWPGAWDLSAAEHLKPGETFWQGAIRGLQEELSVKGVDLQPLGDIRTFRLDMPEIGVRDYEVQQSFGALFDGEVSADPEEVLETRWVDLQALADELAERPQDFTPWFRAEIADLNLGSFGGDAQS